MNRTPPFDSPFLLGFEHTRALIERAERSAAEAYPPYNVEDLGDGKIRIVLAVAGFVAGELGITVEANQLTITGRHEVEGAAEAERAFVHRGIASRGFVRGFILADGLHVVQAWLDHGLLNIEVLRPKSAEAVRRISIETVRKPVSPGSR